MPRAGKSLDISFICTKANQIPAQHSCIKLSGHVSLFSSTYSANKTVLRHRSSNTRTKNCTCSLTWSQPTKTAREAQASLSVTRHEPNCTPNWQHIKTTERVKIIPVSVMYLVLKSAWTFTQSNPELQFYYTENTSERWMLEMYVRKAPTHLILLEATLKCITKPLAFLHIVRAPGVA